MQTIITRLLFFVISSAIYPLLTYVIAPWLNSLSRDDGNNVGAAHAATGIGGYGDVIGAIILCILWFILSSILAQLFVRAWWIGVLALITGVITISLVYQHSQNIEANRLYPYEKYYDNGTVRESGNRIGRRYDDDRRHGEITTYYMDGAVKSIETYKMGELFGISQSYHPNGKLMAKGSFKGSKSDYVNEIGIPDGTWVYYHKSGRIDDERTYAEGKLLSSNRFKLCFDSTGLVRTIAKGELFTGSLVKQGIVNTSYIFPNLYTTQVKNGEFDGHYCSYYTIGDELVLAATTTRRNGKRDGVSKYYHTNGQLDTDAFYVDGNEEGVYTTYYADSVATEPHGQVQYSCNYKNGERHGTARSYNDNGTLNEETEYFEGKKNGVSRKYRPDGRLVFLYTYKNDEQDGAFESHLDSGEYEKGYYKSGSMTFRESYLADGTLYSVHQWQDGECIRSEQYDENGKLR